MKDCTGHRHLTGGPLDGLIEHLAWVNADEFPAVLVRELTGGRRYRYSRDPRSRGAEVTYLFSGEVTAAETVREAS
jgi:hypothetical protein